MALTYSSSTHFLCRFIFNCEQCIMHYKISTVRHTPHTVWSARKVKCVLEASNTSPKCHVMLSHYSDTACASTDSADTTFRQLRTENSPPRISGCRIELNGIAGVLWDICRAPIPRSTKKWPQVFLISSWMPLGNRGGGSETFHCPEPLYGSATLVILGVCGLVTTGFKGCGSFLIAALSAD